jgi:hypothetical protein
MQTRPYGTLEAATAGVSSAMGVSAQELIASFSPASEADLPAIIDLRQRVIGDWIGWDDEAYLRWRYRLGRSQQGQGECWVLRQHGRAIAILGTEELTLRTRGVDIQAVRIMDLLVDVTHRHVGLTIWILLRMTHAHEAVMTLGSNANSRKLVGKLFKRLPDRIRWVANLRLGVPLHRRFPAMPKPLADLIALPADMALHAWRQARHAPSADLAVTREASVPPEAQRLHRSEQAPCGVGVVRTDAHWQWRLQSPRMKGHDIWCVRQRGVLLGMLIVRHDRPTHGAASWSILDVVLGASEPDLALQVLLRGLFASAWRNRVTHIHWTVHRRDLTQALQGWGFVDRSDSFCTMSLHGKHAALLMAAEEGACWDIGEIHMDSD